ncbi:hypothetical protein TrRE_jg8910, partial [Triparma retinervis]
TMYLIRHGESLGQAAKSLGLDRKRSPALTDAGLTVKGQRQASQIAGIMGGPEAAMVDLVVTSPLTRAMHTALLGFGEIEEAPVIVDYDIREIGSRLPENVGRDVRAVLRDLRAGEGFLGRLDYETRKPEGWPGEGGEGEGKREGRAERVRGVMRDIAGMEEISVVAVVCHHNVIQSILGPGVKPKN